MPLCLAGIEFLGCVCVCMCEALLYKILFLLQMLILSKLGMSQGTPQELACQRQRTAFTVEMTESRKHEDST